MEYCILKHSQYKNDATQLLHGEGKKAAISNLRSFSTELGRSYIDYTLERITSRAIDY